MTSVTTPRRDAFADAQSFPDLGCHLHPRCLMCPEPNCYLDRPRPGRVDRAVNRAVLVRSMRKQGKTVSQVATGLGLSRRSVYRLSVIARRVHDSTHIPGSVSTVS